MDKDTVAMYFVGAALTSLTHAARARVLEGAGISADLLAAGQARVPAESFAALWLGVAREIDDEFFGLDTRRMKVGSFALLCRAVLHSDNLEHAVKNMLRGFAVFFDDIAGELYLADQQAVIRIHNQIADPAARRFADETFLVMVHGLMCWLTGQRIKLNQVQFAQSRPAHAREYTLMFSEYLMFNAPRTAIWFDARLLRAPIVQNETTVKEFLRSAPESVFLKYRNQDSWTARLRRRLRDGVAQGQWPLLEELAKEFNLTSTTLRRRLDAEGTSYQGIKDELRRDAAIEHLCHSNLSIAEIAGLLGFQEPSAFHRAFKKWNGVQPGQYRVRRSLGLGAGG